MSLELGALLEPLSVAIHATRRAQLAPAARVLVLGAGAIGLLTAAMARIGGAIDVVIADVDQGRLDFAVANDFAHASYTVPLARDGQTLDEALDFARATAAAAAAVTGGAVDATAPPEFDAVFECTGVPSCAQTAIYVSFP